MIIAVPASENKGMTSTVYGHFGSAPFYMLYNTDSGALEIMDNTTKEHAHGQCTPATELSEKNVGAVVCGGMGFRAINNLRGMGIKVYLAESAGSVDDIVAQWKNNNLREISDQDACGEHHGCH
ncbi:MAG: dinitrogenase iron-molybdenum cofactor biosynthesis protein [Brevinematales bacterium]|nr:dinitrogenase iron-molybdenum cofactor biosynthesis protein [Brevinematales bacterium]